MYIQIAIKENPNKQHVTSSFNSIEELQIYLNRQQFILVEMYTTTYYTKALINTNSIIHCSSINVSQIDDNKILLVFNQ